MENLTSSQKSIWVTEQYYKGSSVNNISGFALMEEQIDFEKLEQAIQIVCQKHDNFWLRLKIEDGEVKQVLSQRKKVEIDTIVFDSLKELKETANKIARTPFNIEKSELFKFYIFKLKNGQGGFMPSIHHLISDAWTIALISNEVIKAYSELKHNQEVETEAIYSYIDYIKSEQEYLQSEKYQKDKTYWEEKFTQIPDVATIPGSKENVDENDPSGNRKKFELQTSKVEKIKKYCKENKISLYNFFMAIYAIYIGEISNLDEFVIGTPILNRTNYKEKSAMGMFVNMAPFKINMSQDIDFKTFVKNIASDSMSMLKHQKYSYQHLLENLRNKNKSLPNLYNIFLSYQITNAHQSGEDMDYTIEWVYNGCCAEHIDIQIFDINDTGNLNISYDYKTSIYEDSDIENVHKRIENIINQVIEKESIEIKDIEIVTPDEKQKLVTEFNKTELKYDTKETVISLFEKQVENTPEKIAVISNGQKLTYKQLNEKANILAKEMQEKGVKQKDIIGIMLNRSPEMIIGLIAILKCGATYLPIDPEYPIDRISYMLENSETKLVLVNENTEKYVPANCSKINIKNVQNKNKQNLNLKIDGDTLVYLIYTSGSTGKPKGVQLTNRNLNNFIKGMKKEIDFNPEKTMVSVTTICFDIFGLEMWCSLTSGQTLVVANEQEQNMPVLLNKLCLENNVNMIQTTPSRYSVLFEDTKNLKFFENITEILVGGEAVNEKVLANMKKYSKARIFNVYGPTETTIWSTIKELTNSEPITIGKPIANTQCYILNKNQKVLPINMPGELYIGGDGVSNGYLKRDDLNEEKFIKSPFIENRKIYNTNDLAYFNEEGELIHLGRTDFQVKIRGFRIELGEIENVIEKNENVNQAVVVKRKLQNGNDALVAYYSTNSPRTETIEELKKALNAELPQYMVPQYFVELQKMPHTPNGKIDRKSLPEPHGQGTDKVIVKPRNQLDKELINIIGKMLRLEQISIEDKLLDLGGDSLTAITLSTKILSKYNVQINIKDIISGFTVKDISDFIKNSEATGLKERKIEKVQKQEAYPLSSAQTRMYYSSAISSEDSILYNIPGAVIIDGKLDSKLLEKCFSKIIERHESLRTYFEIQNQQVVQKIQEKVDFKLEVLKNINFNKFEQHLKQFVKPFNLKNAPLFRVQYVEFMNGKSAIFLDIHHIIADGKSISILIDEICKLYNNLDTNLPELQYTYKDFSNIQYKEAEEYWIKQFEGELPVLNMPTKGIRPVTQSFEGARVYQTIDNITYDKILNISKKLNVTPYMFLLCAYYILLEKYTGQEDIIIGTPSQGRELQETQNIIGMFVNTLPLRNNVNDNYTVSEFLKNLKTSVIDGFKNEEYPFNKLVEKLNIKRDASRNVMFDTMFIYQSGGYEKFSINNVNAKYYIPDMGISKYDLSLEAVPLEENMKLTFEYCTKLFDEEFVKCLSENYINILNLILDDINIKISDIEILSKKMKQKIVYEFNDTEKKYPEKTFSTLFEEQVEKTPNKVAIVFEDKQLTYKELNEKSNSLAYYLRNVQKIKKQDAVGIMINRSMEMIIAILGIMKAGGAYIPIDPSFPQDRINYMLETSAASVLITNKKNENSINYKNKITIDLDNKDIYSLPNTNLKNINDLSDLLYIIFTSGSTGRPKGVMQTQKTLVNFAHYCNDYVGYLKQPKNQTIVSISTMSFDIFSYEALIPLQRGVKVVIANENEQITPNLLNDLMVKNNVTATQATPSVMQIFVNNIDNIPYLKNIKYLTLTGEQVPINLVKKLKSFGNMIIYDGYGPTETYYCTLTEIKNNDFITIGKPFYNDQMYILDKHLKPVPIGVVGEIYIAGDGLAKGYLKNPELTAQSFIKNPFKENAIMYKSGDLGKYLENGDIICLGRSDNQIKIRGLRIELEEIETLISKYPNIEKVAVLKQSANNREFISAYFVAKKRISINELRKYLSKSLPRYMIPSYYVPLDEFIYTPNGKIDKKQLPLPKELSNMTNEEYVAPKTELQKKLVKIFESILNTNPIGINDNFFELGGDSLLAMKLNIELLKITNKISYSDIFKYSTVCEMEEKINSDGEIYIHNKIEQLPEECLKILENTKKENIAKEYHPKNILLTGVTGYLGIHILEEFLKNEKCKIYCIIRKEPGLSINKKIIQKLNYYFGDKYNDLINERIIPVHGDICKPNFGLQQEELLKVANDIDIVINSAANVAHFGVYEKFYKTNVKSVEYIVDFCKTFNKKLYQISTTGVSGKKMNPNYEGKKHNGDFDESCAYIGQYIDNVYTYTKFEAENVVLNAIVQGIDAYILRVGNLMPRLSDGLFQENIKENAFLTKINDIMKLGMIPEYLLDMPLEFTPVDTAAQAIYKLVTNYSKPNKIFHVYNHNMITLEEYLETIKNFGYNVKVIPEDIFKENISNILKNENKKNNLQNLVSDLDNNYHLNYNGDIKLNSSFSIKYLQKCKFNWPTITKEYVINFIKLMGKEI